MAGEIFSLHSTCTVYANGDVPHKTLNYICRRDGTANDMQTRKPNETGSAVSKLRRRCKSENLDGWYR